MTETRENSCEGGLRKDKMNNVSEEKRKRLENTLKREKRFRFDDLLTKEDVEALKRLEEEVR